MSDKSAIEWTDATWNPIVGCSIVSPGCTNCYAMKMAARLQKMNVSGGSNSNYLNHYDGTTQASKAGAVWTGKVALAPNKLFLKPLSWKQPRRIFVNSMGDLFHESISDEWIDRVFAVMALCPRHTFQILTKRAERMHAYVSRWFMRLAESDQIFPHPARPTRINAMFDWAVMPNVLPNVWLGVSAERQKEADERIPLLRDTPAAVRFVSFEPLLGHIDPDLRGIHWAIVGGESGHDARPMHPVWPRRLRNVCAEKDVAFFFKQWGTWKPSTELKDPWKFEQVSVLRDGRVREWDNSEGRLTDPDMWTMCRVGKKSAGRLLDGREHNDFPISAAPRSPVMTQPSNAETVVP